MLMAEPDRSAHDGYIANYRRTGQARIIGIGREVQGQRKDGSLFSLELSIAEWLADGRRYFTGIMRDVTDRKRSEEALRRAQTALQQVQKMEAIGQLTGRRPQPRRSQRSPPPSG
jgi:PAS domain-containing protein